MSTVRRVSLKLECLEERLPLAADLLPLAPPVPLDVGVLASVDAGSLGLIDPTEDPVDPSGTAVSAQVTAVGSALGGLVQTVTVELSAPAGFPSATTLTLVINGSSYTVELLTVDAGNQVTLLVSGGINSANVTVGDQGSLVFSDGGTPGGLPPVTAPSDPGSVDPPLIDPTEDPVG